MLTVPARGLRSGDVVDGFTLGRRLHEGGMAILWEVTHPEHSLPMVMKVPRIDEGDDPAAIVSFEMEQMILPRLSGPHVPRFIASADFERLPFLVMERIAGESMLPLIRNLPMAPDVVAAHGARIAVALDSPHRQHVIHLDLKPSNILARPSGEAVLIDFGLSHHQMLPDLMAEEFRLPYGTAPYMAPEQSMGIRTEPRSDLFALGVLMYFLVTGDRPFGDPQRLKDLRRRLWSDPTPPRRLNPGCPPWLQEIILRCLEVDPERRHPTAAQLAFDLTHADQVMLTPRAEKAARDPWSQRLRRRFNPEARPQFRRKAANGLSTAPILAVAVDLDQQDAALADALRDALRRILALFPAARIACLNVLRLNRIAVDSALDQEGRNKHAQRLVELRHWAQPLGLPEGRVTFTVLEAVSPATALLDYLNANPVEHILLGARANSTMRSLLGSVSGEVAAQAPCTVTVVRARRDAQEAG
ncbi:MAG TPA: bifunctional serine/threonine-protein kinase/universal stress protein [Acetobacteraceae bacterium]|nr:bifunctional serine/threonine-protein kinase/universal stress protein [Acetobacteraceae bacterium]